MSHFTVTVRLSASRLKRNSVEDALAKIMDPFCEQTEDPKYLSFSDEEDEAREKYKNDSVEMVKLENGTLVYPWDEQFRNKKDFLARVEPPAHLPLVQVSHASRFSCFEIFMKEWHGSEGPDPKTGRYGHWRNENGFWDWFTIGGRWTGFYPIKASAKPRLGKSGAFDNKPPKHPCSDIVKVNDIDMDFVATETRKHAESFWKEWSAWVDSDGQKQETDPWSGPRSQGLSIGLVEVVRGPATATDTTTKVIPWLTSSPKLSKDDERRHWNDVVQVVTEDQFMSEYIDAFCPITTFAALDDDGWHQPGKMGWWGCDHSEASAKRIFQKEFVKRFIRNVPTSDLLVCVDCHV